MKEYIAWIKSWPKLAKILVPVITAIVIIGITITVILLQNSDSQDNSNENSEQTVVSDDSETEVLEEETESKQVQGDVPFFTGCSVVTESLERDLTIYVESESASQIKGSNFSFKVVQQQDEDEKIKEAMAELARVNESINALQEKNGTADFSLDQYKKLLVEKKEIIDQYAAAVGTLEGESYSDEDADGMIYIEDISAGSYQLYYLPVDGYDPNEYVVSVKVLAQAEYKAIETIQKKLVAESEAKDTEPSHRDYTIVGEAADTVKTTDTMTITGESEYSKPKEMDFDIQAEVSETLNRTTQNCSISQEPGLPAGESGDNSDDLDSGFGESQEASTQQAKLEISKSAKLYACEGASFATLICNKKLVDGISVELSGELSELLEAEWTGKACEISLKDLSAVKEDVKGTLTIQGVDVSGNPITVNSEITIAGSSSQIYGPEGEELFVRDKNGTMRAATLADYAPDTQYAVKEKSEITEYYGWQSVKGNRYYYDADGNKVTGTQTIDGVEYKFDSSGRLLKIGGGIDVSGWQGEINWKQAANYISYAIIRCGYRGESGKLSLDTSAVENIKSAKAAGVQVGLYFYSRAKTPAQAVEEASVAVMIAKESKGLNYPIYIALEDSVMEELTKTQMTAVASAFCKTVSNSGYRAGVYATKDWLTDKMDMSELSGYSVWCVEFNTKCTYGRDYGIWQYTAKGVVPGVPGKVNLNK